MNSPRIWLVTYPKSGTTWVRSMWSALEQDGKIDINELNSINSSDRYWVEYTMGISTTFLDNAEIRLYQSEACRYFFEAEHNQTLIKSHDALIGEDEIEKPILNQSNCDRIIHVIRDPRDIAVSCQYYFQISLDRAIDMICDSKCWLNTSRVYSTLPIFLSDWSAHTKSIFDSNLPSLLVRYEDLKQSSVKELGRIVEFCQLPYSNDAVRAAANSCNFQNLALQERLVGYKNNPSQDTSRFFRRGESGNWRKVMSIAQVKRIIDKHGLVMESLGYLSD
ncbi:sulfotransferase [Alteromonas sp. KUL42]|uniref:sulfotransferase domain-containing protein n=1 Tax=Alteromonas sp. KUL42 TaxID=2480797 RepID=UPI001036898A|nr:sulfotransferase domain-containing protein [Alteromonas sp. KUL42]TAP35140.1 sulfotransferase domain-containing protein [Alteromonas sp. KUL42]GEA07429.1 sulfotransferase [Alteromonas sp. KUL42]